MVMAIKFRLEMFLKQDLFRIRILILRMFLFITKIILKNKSFLKRFSTILNFIGKYKP